MKYLRHDLNTVPTLGILLVNLGTPDAPTPKALRRYLAEFLADPRVVELPRWLWWPVLHGIILRFRPRYSAKLYQKIWTTQGSPLLVLSNRLTEKLQTHLQEKYSHPIKIALGMRYGNPSIQSALTELHRANIDKLLILPLYPQYSAAATGSVFDQVSKILTTWRYVPELHMINNYAEDPNYIDAIALGINSYWQTQPAGDKLLFSFHGIPQRKVDLGDPYYLMCQRTAQLVAEKLNLPKERWLVVFQSRFGRQAWLQPYCDKTLINLARNGIKNVDIVCPGFAVDCLETLEEICVRNKEIFLHAGGIKLNYIPALNDSSAHVNALTQIALAHLLPNSCSFATINKP